MFITLLNPILCFYHIVIHPLFKPILFLFIGSFIHIQYNYQNIFQLKLINNNYFILFLLSNNILILSISKETIIHNIIININNNIINTIIIIGSIFTFLYIIKILLYCFYL